MKDEKRLHDFYHEIREIISHTRNLTVKSVNTLQVVSNYLIGKRIVEFEQEGKTRASYGKETLKDLSEVLTEEFGKGYSKSNLEYMRKFFVLYSDRIQQITQTVSGQSVNQITQTVSGLLPSLILESPEIPQTLSAKFPLSWSHYVFLMSIENEKERSFYEDESIGGFWSLRELKRQFDASLYERLTLSRNKKSIKKEAEKGVALSKPEEMIKDPYVLEFLGLDEKAKYTETDLETAIINKLEYFLLELGKGFLFEARQKRFTLEEDHFYVDLVFYNRLLRSYVLIDLKIGELRHQDLGQMQMYVNYFDRFVKLEDENPTIGIILCKKKKDALVEITLPKDSHIHASEYKLYLPSKEDLKKQIEQAERELEFHAEIQ